MQSADTRLEAHTFGVSAWHSETAGRLELPSRGQPSAKADAPVNAQTQHK
jgi:hypothetical protein